MTTLAPDRAVPAARPAAEAEVARRVPEPAAGPDRKDGRLRSDSGTRAWLRRKAVAAWMNILIAGAVAVTVVTAGVTAGSRWPQPGTWGISALKLFALWCLAFLPGWLYVRFLDLRAKALWSEYVLNLHRLGWDLPWHLPMPSVASGFYQRWEAGPHGRPADNIYRQKFEAYYGRQITSTAPDENYSVRSESLFPVFLATAVLAVGWAAVLWDTRFVTHPSGPWDVLKYGFLGSYAFVTSMLIRRFFQSDLRPSAYATAVYRIMLVLLIVTVLHQVLGGTAAVAEPRRARRRLRRRLLPARRPAGPAAGDVPGAAPVRPAGRLGIPARPARRVQPVVRGAAHRRGRRGHAEPHHDEPGRRDPAHPGPGRPPGGLDRPGVPADPPGAGRPRRAEPAAPGGPAPVPGRRPAGRAPLSGAQARLNLRRVGIRTATDLLKAFSVEQEGGKRVFRVPDGLEPPLPPNQLRLLVAVLAAEPGLAPVWNWQRNGVPDCRGGAGPKAA